MKLKVVWEGRYRYHIESEDSAYKCVFDSVDSQAEHHVKVLELLMNAQDTIDRLNLRLHLLGEKVNGEYHR